MTDCMKIVNEMAQEDQEALLARLDQYQNMGVPAEKAQKMAAKDLLEEITQEHDDFLAKAEEQHPDNSTAQGNSNEASTDSGRAVGSDREGNIGSGSVHNGTAPRYGKPIEGSVAAVGYHFSKQPRSSLDGTFYGTGLKGAEAERLSGSANNDIRPRVFFYVDKGNGIRPESGVGAYAHHTQLDNLYDVNKDELFLVRKNPNANTWERAIMEAGFDGYLADTGGQQKFAVLVGKKHSSVPVAETNAPGANQNPVTETKKSQHDTRRSSGKLVRKPTDAEMLDILRNRKDIEAAADSFKLQYGEASVNEDQAPLADKVLADAGSTFQFGEAKFSEHVYPSNPKLERWVNDVRRGAKTDPGFVMSEQPHPVAQMAGLGRSSPVILTTNLVRHIGNKGRDESVISASLIAQLPEMLKHPRAMIRAMNGGDESFNFILDHRDGVNAPLLVAMKRDKLRVGSNVVSVTDIRTMFHKNNSMRFILNAIKNGEFVWMTDGEIARVRDFTGEGPIPYGTNGAAPPQTSSVPNTPSQDPHQRKASKVSQATSTNVYGSSALVKFARGDQTWKADSVPISVSEKQLSKAAGVEFSEHVSYASAPDNLMGYRKDGPQKGFEESNYKHVEFVRVTWPDGETMVDAMRGLNKPHAIERARRNWRDAEIQSISREEADAADPGIVAEVDSIVPPKPSKPVYTHEVVDPRDGNKVVGKYQSANAARNGRDRLDNKYGGYRYRVREIGSDGVSYSMQTGTSTWDMYENSKFDNMVYKMQNKMIDVKRVIESITKYVGSVADDLNVYLQEELFHGRAAKRTHDFAQLELEPLMKDIKADGFELSDVEEYLHARHAKEANAVIASRDPGMPDGGSGMTDAESDAYFQNLSAEDEQKLSALAAKVDAIISQTRQLYVDYGLETQATVDGWNQMFKHYIPLQREDKDGNGSMGIGQGFSVKGKETRGRTGSRRKVVDILANIAMQRERLIVRGEKNRVSNALVGLATANPNPEFWSVGKPPTERVYDPKTNSVVDRADPLYKSRENVIVAKVKDANGDVNEVAVVFNEDDERAVRMAQALKNLDAGDLEGLLGVSAKITRYFSAVNTQYNPVFGVVNAIRDVQHAMITLDRTPLAKKKGRIARDTISALSGIYKDMRAMRKGQHPTSQWSQLWEEFQDEGGQTGYRQMFATSADRAKELQETLNPDAWLEGKYSKIFTANGALKVPLSAAKKSAGAIFDWLSDYNESMENGVRLAAYKAALDQGMSKPEAASLAKNLTVNFNRKGQIGQQAGAVYAFFNAAMQGMSNIGQTLFTMEGGDLKTIRLSQTGKKVVYGGMLLGAMQALALAAAGFSDDDPPEFVRAKSLIIPTGGRSYVTIPMPQGFNVLPGMGRSLTEFALGGFKSPAKRAIGIFGMFADNFNPIGNAGMSMQTIAPTALDPLVALTENRDFTGKPIARVSSNKAVPGFTQYKDSATVLGKLVAEGINGVTGGNAYVAGALSPTPDQIDYLLGQVTGGVGRELSKVEQTALNLAHGETLPIHKIPLAGRFYGDAASQASQGGQFYANVNQLNELETEIKAMRKDGKVAEANELQRSRPDAYLIAQANVAERQVQRLNREKRDMVAKGADREAVKAKEEQITAVMTRLNQAAEKLREKEAAH